MSLSKSIYEHLITKGKYRRLENDYNVLKRELENKIIDYENQNHIHKAEKKVWERKLIEQEEQIIKLKKRKIKKETK